MKEKLSKGCEKIYGIGCVVVLGLAALCTIGFVISFFVGAQLGTAINTFIRWQILPYVVMAGVVVCAVAMIKLYLDGEHVFTIDDKGH